MYKLDFNNGDSEISLLSKAVKAVLKRKKGISTEQLNGDTAEVVFNILNNKGNSLVKEYLVRGYADRIAEYIGHGKAEKNIQSKLTEELIDDSEKEFYLLVERVKITMKELNNFFINNDSPGEIVDKMEGGKKLPKEIDSISTDLVLLIDKVDEFEKNFDGLNKISDENIVERGRNFLKRASLFADVLSHDIKTPLNQILGFSQSIIDKDFTEKEIPSILSKIKKQVVVLKIISNEIMPLSREPDVKEVNLSSETMRDLLKESVDKRQLDIELDNIFYTDVNLLQVIIKNIASNSLKFTSSISGKVEIKSEELGSDMSKITITDNGYGIPNDTLDILNKINSGEIAPKKVDSQEGANGEIGTGKGSRNNEIIAKRIGVRIMIRESNMKGTSIEVYVPTTKEKFEEIKNGGNFGIEKNIDNKDIEENVSILVA